MTESASRFWRAVLAITFMTIAANCFLKYLWWAANYSVWQGLPKYADQWRAAGVRTSVYGWTLVVLEIASLAVLHNLIRLRFIESPAVFRNVMRLIAALLLTIAGTGLFALVLSWIKQGPP